MMQDQQKTFVTLVVALRNVSLTVLYENSLTVGLLTVIERASNTSTQQHRLPP